MGAFACAVTTTQKIIENGVAQLANQPTIGLYYLRVWPRLCGRRCSPVCSDLAGCLTVCAADCQEHVISATPQLLEDHNNVAGLTSELEVCVPSGVQPL
jgi:hypothetical protein